MGFTSCDRNLTITDENGNKILYEARSSVEPSAVRSEASGGVDNLEVIGLLQSTKITDSDIRAGRYDGAKIEVFVTNYLSLGDGKVILLLGNIGEVSISTGQFTAEIRSLSARIGQSVGELTSPLCRVKLLGDLRCTKDLTSFRYVRTVAQIDSVYQIRFTNDTHTDDWFTYGKVEVTSGANAGFKREVKDHFNSGTNAVCILQEAFPFAFVIGDAVILEAGCDRQMITCRDKFSNLVNFRGEPYIPGTDKVLKVGRR